MIRIVADDMITPAGIGAQVNVNAVLSGESAIRKIDDRLLWPDPFYGALLSVEQWNQITDRFQHSGLTKLEMLMAQSIDSVSKKSGIDLKNSESQLILATTKGNIDLLAGETEQPDQSLLFRLGENLQRFFHAARPVLIVSNACTSGLLAVINGARMLESGAAKNVIVCGGDLLTRFTLSGFQSFKAVSQQPCKPYDAHRDGINLGEGVGALALTNSDDSAFPAYISGATANDANHISGPSRTGEGLFQSVRRTMFNTGITPGMISAHGTATLYNDEMECQAFNRMNYQQIPLHSLKGIYGHTLGAAGVIETILALKAMQMKNLPASTGYTEHGVTLPLNVTKETTAASYSSVLKTSSGFGGSNAAALFAL